MKHTNEKTILSWWSCKSLPTKLKLIKNFPRYEFFFRSPFSLTIREIELIYNRKESK